MKGNFKVLTDSQVAIFNDRFEFEDVGNGFLVRTKDYNRAVFHSKDQSFQTIANVDDKKITVRISVKAIQIWEDPDIRVANTLIEVQNAVNKAATLDNSVDMECIQKYLK